MQTYNLRKTDKIVIYGAAYIGRDIKERIGRNGYRIACFMDKRASVLQMVDGVEVIHPEQYNGIKEDTIIIIATGNPCSVANYLSQLGYSKIIYNVLSNGACSESGKRMANVYDSMLNGEKWTENIPCYEREAMDNTFYNNALIVQQENQVIAYLSTDLIFMKEDEDAHIYSRYADLLKYLKAYDGNTSNIIEDIYALSERIFVEKLNGSNFEFRNEDRRLYTQTQLNMLNMRLNYGMEWFIDNPINVELNEAGNKFYIKEKDVFKVLFLLSKGLQRVPAKMSELDYKKWINEECLEETLNYAQNHDLLTSYTLLEHPNVYNFPAARDIGGNARMPKICEYLEKKDIIIKGKKVLDVGSYFGFLSRFFYRMGAKVTSVEYNPDTYGFGKCLNKLLHCEAIETICGGAQDVKRENEFDITIMLTVLYWHLDNEIGVPLLQAVDAMTKHMMIWESGAEPEREKKFILENSNFRNYIKIGETVGTGKVRELGVWYKDECK